MRAVLAALPLLLLTACGWRAGLAPPPLPSGATPACSSARVSVPTPHSKRSTSSCERIRQRPSTNQASSAPA